MKMKNVELKWYVFRWDFNAKKITNYNVLSGLAEDIAKKVQAKKINNKDTLKEYLKKEFMYHYWSRTEHEVYISDLHGSEGEKIDIWRQVEPNLDNIVDYVNLKMELKF